MDEDTNIQILLARHDGRLSALEAFADQQRELNRQIADLCVAIGKLQMQIKVSWALEVMIISGLIGIAFSVFSGV